MKICRFAIVQIEASLDYLTATDEETEADGWREVESRLIEYLRGFNRHYEEGVPTAKFVDWEEE
jgi:hypothetical protein